MNERFSEDARLVERGRGGDRAALEELIRRYQGGLYSVVLRRVGDAEKAADVTQEAFIQAILSLPSLKRPEKFGAWLRSIARHVCADRQASQLRRVEHPLSGDLKSPAEPQELRELRRTIREAMKSLSHANRLAVTMFYFDGLSCREVAEFCDVGVSAIKSRLHEARRHMRKEITKMEGVHTSERTESCPDVTLTYSGSCDVDVLFWSPTKKHCAPALYSGIYPDCGLDDEAVWQGQDDAECVDQLRRLWHHAGVIRTEGDRVLGLVPVYTDQDHERFAAWHARTSRAVVDRFKQEEDTIDDLVRDFKGGRTDQDNLRRITIVGRVLAGGVEKALHGGLFQSAHDWGGLGRAFIWGQHQGLGPAGPYSMHTSGAPGVSFSTFQHNLRFPGLEVIAEYGREATLGLLGRLCTAPQSWDDLSAEAGDQEEVDRLAAMLEALTAALWVEEENGLLSARLPFLQWPASRDEERVRGLGQRLIEPVADAADELKALAAQSSFAHCRFADVAFLLTAKMRWYVVRDLTRDGIIVPQPDPMPPGWGAWLCLSDGR